MGGALFMGFVAYATVQTQPNREEQLSNQEVTVLENTKVSPLKNSVLPKKSPSPSVLSATVIESSIVPGVTPPVVTNPPQPENIDKGESSKKYHYEDEKDGDDGYEEEYDD